MKQDSQNDWIDSLRHDFRQQFIGTIKSLSLDRLQKYPPPKLSGLPVGHELRILRRLLSGGCSMLDPSALSNLYRLPLPSREKVLYRAFILGEALPESEWSGLIGPQQVAAWREHGLLRQSGDGLVASFRVIAIGKATMVVDPLDVMFANRVHIGGDSLKMIEFLKGQKLPTSGRYLDVGTGAGAILLQLSSGFGEAVAVDINPRAIALAQLNIESNAAAATGVYEEDIFTMGERHGSFDLVTWNVPFMFFPESYRNIAVDGYGGEMGIGLTLKFIDVVLPQLLTKGGMAWLLSSAPILEDNQNLLATRLDRIAAESRLDISMFVRDSFWVKEFEEFHRSHGIRFFRSVFLRIRRGGGSLNLVNASSGSHAFDRMRRLLHHK